MTSHGGTITGPGAPTVMIGGMPAACQNDMHVCPMVNPGVPPPPHVGGPIMLGAMTVKICGKPAARVGDMCQCSGPPDSIAMGCFTVMINDSGGGGGGGGSGAKGTAQAAGGKGEPTEGHYLDVAFVDKGGKTVTGVGYEVRSPDNKTVSGVLSGPIKMMGIKQGNYEITLKSIYKAEWSTKQAAVGDKVKLLAEAAGIDSGEKATLEIYIKDANFADHLLKVIESKVSGGKIQEEWELQIDEALLNDHDLKRQKGSFSNPSFYFMVKAGGLSCKSGILVYKDYVEIELKDEAGKPAAGVKYKAFLPNGEIREGKLDNNGYAKVNNVPPGRVEVSFDVRGS